MLDILQDLIKGMNDPDLDKMNVLNWGSPIISFGDFRKAKIGTLGLNPSNLEFLDASGNELNGVKRRFQTLNSLGLSSWSNVKREHLRLILKSSWTYFQGNPYNEWFKKLDFIISGTSISYYLPSYEACHLDLIPYTTTSKWAELSANQRASLFRLSEDFLGNILKHSPIHILILNGKSVVNSFEKMSGTNLETNHIPSWDLLRPNNKKVKGFSFIGEIKNFQDINFEKRIKIIGYNHNIQSSYGISKEVLKSIRDWITLESKEAL
jgi:hypothetical protein